jgi:hypothetical protein
MRRDRPQERGGLTQGQPVHAGNAHGKGGMMQAEIERPRTAFRQHARQPIRAPVAEDAVGAAGLHRIQDQENAFRRVDPALHETVGIPERVRKRGVEIVTVIVVADGQVHRHGQRLEGFPQQGEGIAATAMGEVAGDEAEGGIPLSGEDVGDTGAQAPGGVGAIERLIAPDQMGVREMDEFQHDAGS